MPGSLGEFMAVATSVLALCAAIAYWARYAAATEKGVAGAVVKTAATGLLAVLLAFVPGGGWFWLVPLGLALVLSTEFWLAPRTGGLRWPVRIYVLLIALMGISALLLPVHPGQGWLRLGAVLFILSDLMLALQLFVVRDAGWQRRLALALWPAYWLGQALIAWGAVVFWQAGPV